MKSFEIRTREKFLELEKKIKALFTRDVAYNLLDNSNFRNPVNQRGATSYSGGVYSIDRWKGANADVTVNNGSISVSRGSQSYGLLVQFCEKIIAGKTYTFMAENTTGEIAILVVTAKTDMGMPITAFRDATQTITVRYSSNTKLFYVGFSNTGDDNMDIVRCALYEGEYTAETLPEYMPKGYAQELLECQRYFERISTMNNNEPAFTTFASGCFNAADIFLGVLNVMPKRVAPNVTFNGNFRIRNNGTYAVTAMESNKTMSTQTTVYIKATVSGAIAGYGGLLQSNNDANAYIDISADL